LTGVIQESQAVAGSRIILKRQLFRESGSVTSGGVLPLSWVAD